MRRTILAATLLAAAAATPAAHADDLDQCTRIAVYADARAVQVTRYRATPTDACDGHDSPGSIVWADVPPVSEIDPTTIDDYCYGVTVTLPDRDPTSVEVCPPPL